MINRIRKWNNNRLLIEIKNCRREINHSSKVIHIRKRPILLLSLDQDPIRLEIENQALNQLKKNLETKESNPEVYLGQTVLTKVILRVRATPNPSPRVEVIPEATEILLEEIK